MATARVPSPFAVCPCPVRPSPARRMPRADSGKAAGDRTAKVIAHAIAQLLEARGMSGALVPLASSRFGEIRHLVTAVTGRGRVLCEVEVLPRDEGRPTMRKIEIAGLAIVAATALGMWSASTVAQSRVGKAEVVAASAPIAPHAIMVKLGRSLPSEYWSHPY